MSTGLRLGTRAPSRAGAHPGERTSPAGRDADTATRVLWRATHDPELLAGAEIDALQRTVGNRAVVDLIQRAPTPKAPAPPKPKATVDQIAAEIGPALGGPYADYKAYAATMVPGSFLGHPIDRGVRPELLPKLVTAKTKIDAEFALSKNPIPTGYGISSVGGFRFAQGPHGWGFAIDLDVAKNPFVMHEQDEGALDLQLAPVYHRIAEFMLNSPIGGEQSIIPNLIIKTGSGLTPTSPTGRRDRVAEYYDRLTIESEAMKNYFKLMNNSVDIGPYLAGPWKTNHPSATAPAAADVLRQMWQDYAILGGAIPKGGPAGVPGFTAPAAAAGDRPFNPRSAGQQDPAAGFLTLPREVVLGLSQALTRWGAIDFFSQSGDVQHFDDMGGLGATITAATNAAVAKLVAKAAAAAPTTAGTGSGSSAPTVSPQRDERPG